MIRLALAALALLVALLLMTLVVASLRAPDPRGALTAGGRRANVSFYLPTSDGVELAVDVWLPPGHRDERLATLVHMTRYWRAVEPSLLGRALGELGLFPPPGGPAEPFGRFFLDAGFAVAAVDSRGTGASQGDWPILFGPREIADFEPVLDWIVAQPWSNGRVGAYGISYPGFTAELAATTRHPALRAVAPAFVYWDVTRDALSEGGVRNEWLIENWSRFTEALDHGDACAASGLACRLLQSLATRGVKPVDDDRDGERMRRLMDARRNPTVSEGLGSYEFRGDPYARSGLSIDEVAPAAHAAGLDASQVAYYVMTGWLDSGGAMGALRRFLAQSNPQEVLIGPWSHGGRYQTDPFLPADAPGALPRDDVMQRMIRFFDRELRRDGRARAPAIRRVSYYVNGAGIWRSTDRWPPEGYPIERWYLAEGGRLERSPPRTAEGSDRYAVDFAAASGESTRHRTTLGGSDVVYPDRRAADTRLLTYTSPPLERAIEITGTPALEIALASSTEDAALYAYLEDVAPDGRVTYLGEGKLRLLHRALAANGRLAGALGPEHSFLERDARPLAPGETAVMRLAIGALSAVIQRDHRLRIAIAGHDASGFRRIPPQGNPVLTVQRGAERPSFLEVPSRPFDAAGGAAVPPLP